MDSISEQINKMLSTACSNQTTITPKSLLVEDLGLDSLGLIELTVLIEDKFNILIPASAIPNINTVTDLYNIVQDPFNPHMISNANEKISSLRTSKDLKT